MTDRVVFGARIGAGVLLVACPGLAFGAALENAVPQPVRLLYEDGIYGEIGFTYIDPHQSGDNATDPNTGAAFTGSTGDVFNPRTHFTFALKGDLGDRLSYLVALDQPYAVDTEYGAGTFPGGFPYAGTKGKITSYQLTGVLAYDVTDRVKAYAGLRAENLDGSADIPFVADYSISLDSDWGYGFLAGAAYARPELGLRVALTYYSKIDHAFDSDEYTLVTGQQSTRTDMDTPQSVTLDVQTGINPKTLLFGSVRWVDWSEFSIAPPVYGDLTGRALVDYKDDWWTYTLGVGRKLTPSLAGSFFVAYEPSVGGTMTSLGPYDGRTTATAALSYDYKKFNILGALTYGVLGDTHNLLETDFDDGSVLGATLRIGYSF